MFDACLETVRICKVWVCVYVCMCVCMYVCMYVYMISIPAKDVGRLFRDCADVYVHVYIYECICVVDPCILVCFVKLCVRGYCCSACKVLVLRLCEYVHTYPCAYVCIHLCMHQKRVIMKRNRSKITKGVCRITRYACKVLTLNGLNRTSLWTPFSPFRYPNLHVWMNMYVCMYVYMYAGICIYACIYVHICVWNGGAYICKYECYVHKRMFMYHLVQAMNACTHALVYEHKLHMLFVICAWVCKLTVHRLAGAFVPRLG